MFKNCNELKIDHKNITFILNGEDIGTSIEYLHLHTYITAEDLGVVSTEVKTKNTTTIEPMQRRNYLKVLATGVYLSHVPVPTKLKRYYTKLIHGFVNINGGNIEVIMRVKGPNFNICTEENAYYNLKVTKKQSPSGNFGLVHDFNLSTDMSDAPVVGDKVKNEINMYNSLALDIPIVYNVNAHTI